MQCFLAMLGLMAASVTIVSGQASSTELTYGFAVGEAMPFHVVEFVAGGRPSHRGCPSVMISNARVRGVEIWSHSADAVPFQLASALEGKLPDDTKPRAFLVLFEETSPATLRAQADQHGLEKFHVAVPQASAEKHFRTAAGPDGNNLLVYLLDRKEIKMTWAFKNAELTAQQIRDITSQAEKFFAGEN